MVIDDVLFDGSTDLGSAAESRDEQTADSDNRSDGNAIAGCWLCPSTIFWPWPLPDPRGADHPCDPMVNPDASRYFCASGSGVIVARDWRGRARSSGNAGRP